MFNVEFELSRYRASTHYRPELTPTERAHKLTAFLHHVATLIHATVQVTLPTLKNHKDCMKLSIILRQLTTAGSYMLK